LNEFYGVAGNPKTHTFAFGKKKKNTMKARIHANNLAITHFSLGPRNSVSCQMYEKPAVVIVVSIFV
jgi:hypothetical protein